MRYQQAASTRIFETKADYETFVDTIVQRMNARVAKLLSIERPCSN
jgi:hypothetical protein